LKGVSDREGDVEAPSWEHILYNRNVLLLRPIDTASQRLRTNFDAAPTKHTSALDHSDLLAIHRSTSLSSAWISNSIKPQGRARGRVLGASKNAPMTLIHHSHHQRWCNRIVQCWVW